MKKNLFSALHPIIVIMVGFGFTGLVSAQDSLPTASLERGQGSEWRNMRPSSFDGTVTDVLRQCNAQASISTTDVLTSGKCDLLARELNTDSCAAIMVPDGVAFDYLQGRQDESSVTSFSQVKRTGREDRALLCHLGDGLYAYWFTGVIGQSCNNLAIVLNWNPPVQATVLPVTEEPEPEPEAEESCQFVRTAVTQLPNSFVHVNDMYTCDCFIPGYTGLLSGGVQSSSKLVCE